MDELHRYYTEWSKLGTKEYTLNNFYLYAI